METERLARAIETLRRDTLLLELNRIPKRVRETIYRYDEEEHEYEHFAGRGLA